MIANRYHDWFRSHLGQILYPNRLSHRIPDYLPLGFPVGVDLATYTQAEFEALERSSPAWHRIISAGEEI
jgi:hypothetical protein